MASGEPAYDDTLWVMEAVGATLVVALLVGAASLFVYDTKRARNAESRPAYSVWRTASRALALAVPSVFLWMLFPVPTWLVVVVPLTVVLWSELDLLLVRREHDKRPVAVVAAAPLGLSEAPPAFKVRHDGDDSPAATRDTALRLSQRLDEAANTGDAVTTASQASRPRGQFGLGQPAEGPDAPDRTVGLERRLIHEALAMGDNSPLPGGRLSETPDVRHRRKAATHYSARGAQSSPATRASAVPSGGAEAGADTPTPSRVVGALRYAQTPGPRLQHAGVDLLRRGGATLPYSDGASRLRSSMGPDVSMARSYTLPGMDGALHTPASGSRRTPAGLLSSGARRVSSGSAHVTPGMRRGSVGRSTLGTPHARLPATITMAGSPLVWAEQERATKAQEDFQQEARAVRRALAEVSLRDSKEEEGEGLREQVEAALINDGSQSLLDEEDQLQGVLVKHLMKKVKAFSKQADEVETYIGQFLQREVEKLAEAERLDDEQRRLEEAAAAKAERRRRRQEEEAERRRQQEAEQKQAATAQAQQAAARAQQQAEAKASDAAEAKRQDTRLFDVAALTALQTEIDTTRAAVKADRAKKMALYQITVTINRNFSNTNVSIHKTLRLLLQDYQNLGQGLIAAFAQVDGQPDPALFRLALADCFMLVNKKVLLGAEYEKGDDSAAPFSGAALMTCLLALQTQKYRGPEVFMSELVRKSDVACLKAWPAIGAKLKKTDCLVAALLGAVFATKPRGMDTANPFGGTRSAWLWMSRLLNQAGQDIASRRPFLPGLLFAFLKFSGHALSARYKGQFVKLLRLAHQAVAGLDKPMRASLQGLIDAALDAARTRPGACVPVPKDWNLSDEAGATAD